MRSLVLSLMLAVCSSSLLVACDDDNAVTARHIEVATDKCAPNDGLKQVESASTSRVIESCGYKCSRATGEHKYTETFSCKNGAKFDLTWQE
jgi:hypothetical protein